MAAVNFFDSFLYKWGQTGAAVTLQDDQYKLGWSFLGSTPPSVEQFNAWGQLSDEKHNWLFGQLNSAAASKGVVLSAGDLDGLLKILGAATPAATQTVAGLIELATPEEARLLSDSSRGITPFTLGEALKGPAGQEVIMGRLINVQTITSSGTYTRTPGATSCIVEGVGGGGAGGGTGNAAAGNVRAGGGGSSGAYGRKRITSLPASVAVTVGSGGVGVTGDGGAGGASSFGAFMSLPGGKGGILGIVVSSAAVSGIGGDVSGNPVGADMGFSGNHGGPGFALSATTAVGGQGGSTPFGANGQFLAATNSTGNPFSTAGLGGSGYGAGGGGAVCGIGGLGVKGGDGQRGIIIVWEYA